jgi:hypothetical protein
MARRMLSRAGKVVPWDDRHGSLLNFIFLMLSTVLSTRDPIVHLLKRFQVMAFSLKSRTTLFLVHDALSVVPH